MARTLFFQIVVRFADAEPPPPPRAQGLDGEVLVAERPAGWDVSAGGAPLDLGEEQRAELAVLLRELGPLPDPKAEAPPPGADGTWYTVVVQRGAEQASYRWWVRAPAEWARVERIAQLLLDAAAAPRRREAEAAREVARRLLAALADGDEGGLLGLYAPALAYRSPLLELRGADEALRMWQALRAALPDLRVTYADHDARPGHATWLASYTFPPTGRRVAHQITSAIAVEGGLVVRQDDRFGVPAWAAQAYGPAGSLVGGLGVFARLHGAALRRRMAAQR